VDLSGRLKIESSTIAPAASYKKIAGPSVCDMGPVVTDQKRCPRRSV